jgi:hypothetical protein
MLTPNVLAARNASAFDQRGLDRPHASTTPPGSEAPATVAQSPVGCHPAVCDRWMIGIGEVSRSRLVRRSCWGDVPRRSVDEWLDVSLRPFDVASDLRCWRASCSP